jgi:hypothetical protein
VSDVALHLDASSPPDTHLPFLPILPLLQTGQKGTTINITKRQKGNTVTMPIKGWFDPLLTFPKPGSSGLGQAWENLKDALRRLPGDLRAEVERAMEETGGKTTETIEDMESLIPVATVSASVSSNTNTLTYTDCLSIYHTLRSVCVQTGRFQGLRIQSPRKFRDDSTGQHTYIRRQAQS